ncbi:hypothetical protein DY926_15685, partial [Komagataeibacter melaceti]
MAPFQREIGPKGVSHRHVVQAVILLTDVDMEQIIPGLIATAPIVRNGMAIEAATVGIGYRVSGIGYRVSGIGYRVSGI